MPISPTYPGVYVQEIPSGVRTIAGVSTSVGLFIGRARQGPLNDPVQCLSFSDYERTFSADSSFGDMARQVKLFFQNGGTQCYTLRIANGAQAATVTLQTSGGTDTLTLEAKQAGSTGDTVRARVEYRGQQPEATFNITIFRLETDGAGVQQELDAETWQNLSMDPNNSLFAADYITQNSKLVNATVHASSPAAGNGFSQSGLPVTHDSASGASFQSAWQTLVGNLGSANEFQVSVDSSRYVGVDLSGIDVTALVGPNIADFQNQLAAEILSAIEGAFVLANLPGTTLGVTFGTGPTPGVNEAPDDASSLLRFTSVNNGDIYVRPASNNDAAGTLRLGTTQGGLEVSAFADARPVPTGISMQMSNTTVWNSLASLVQNSIDQITLPAVDASGAATTVNIGFDLETTSSDDPLYRTGGVPEKLAIIRDAINNYQLTNRRTFFWQSFLAGSRLCIVPTSGNENSLASVTMSPTDIPTTIAGSFLLNVRRYTVGTGGTTGQQTPGVGGNDGNAPVISDYEDAYEIVQKEVDLFNLMILPEDAAPAQPISDLYGAASVFCQSERAFLLMDPPSDWVDSQSASEGVSDLRVGLVNDHSAVFYPRITINEDGLLKNVGPSGAIAGLMSRIDTSRGVWKAPAGVEASLRGVVGLQYQFSDAENGVMNPRAVNTIRVFPNGIVNWGARTMDGDNDFGSEYKYIPIRRLALYMEESLFRGLKWVVFEPNDEPLWAQIRLNVGSFMHGLFRQGAFQGATPKEAYFVKCDSETTTQADRNLGIVNIIVGFAPLKPAEFVILSIQQIAGQLEA